MSVMDNEGHDPQGFLNTPNYRPIDEAPKEWLLMKRGVYYGPNNCGYTGIKDKAGRYSLEEMNASVKDGNGVTGIHESGAPDFTTSYFDDLARDHLIKQRDDARSALRLLKIAVDREGWPAGWGLIRKEVEIALGGNA